MMRMAMVLSSAMRASLTCRIRLPLISLTTVMVLADDKAKLCQVQTNFILTGDLLDGDGLTCFAIVKGIAQTPLYMLFGPPISTC